MTSYPSNQRISVVIPTYLRDTLLAECLQSLAAQTLPLHEVVVVDDGGNGSAREVVAQFGDRFRYVWQPNGGQPSARNHGARVSTGDWIAFLDDDDLWLPERHALVGELIATGQVDLISGNFTKFGEGWVASSGMFDEIEAQSPGFWSGVERDPTAKFTIVGRFPTERLFPVYPFWPSSLVIRRDLFDRINGWEERLRGIKSEDNEFAFRAIKQGCLGVLWTSTVRYRSHAGNESRFELLNAVGRTQVWEMMLSNLELTEGERRALVRATNATLHEIIWSAYREKDYARVVAASKQLKISRLSIKEAMKVFVSRLRTTP